jgi:2-oxoisovalerate dehydrogenase E1 component alpha subunit
MPIERNISEFHIRHLAFIDEAGKALQELPDYAHDKTAMVECYRKMCFARLFDEKAMSLQRTGKLGTYAQAIGQEAVMVGVGLALRPDDIFCQYYRDHATLFQRNVKPIEILRYWGGDEWGCSYQNNLDDLPPCVPIATQALHAAGIATAVKYKKEARAVLTTCGDGATSKGDFYEAMNIAGLWYLPLVFVINNNQWAISVPRARQTAAQTLAQKAISAGISGMQVDGNDVIAVRYAVEAALEKARSGKGPSVIEAINYRLCDHTTADDATRYQSKEEVALARTKEPLIRSKLFLQQQHGWTETEDEQCRAQCKIEIDEIARQYLALPLPQVEDMFDYLFDSLPEPLQEQRAHALATLPQQAQQHD